jgi:DegV family protein with EDD domain
MTVESEQDLSAKILWRKSSMVQVIVDSCASIPDKLVKQLDIKVVPYYIHRGVETLRDLVDVKGKEFFSWLAKSDHVPQTANPGPGDYLTAFRKAAEKAKEMVTIHMTSKGSGAYQSALAAKEMAREMLPELRIEVVDTLQVAMVHGWAAIEAARGALEGLSLEEVACVARDVAGQGTMIQTAETLRYLYLGGRIGRAQHLVGSALKIRPLIGMEDGTIVALGKARSQAKAYRQMISLMQQKVAPGRRIKAAFTHVAALEEAEHLRALVSQRFDCIETLTAELSPALGVHTGPGTVGVCYYVT